MEAEIGGIARQAEERLNELHPDQRPEPKWKLVENEDILRYRF